MHDATRQLEQATWAVAEGRATAEERALLEADPVAWRRTLDRLLVDAEASLASVRGLSGPERERVVADFEDDLARLRARGAALDRRWHRLGRGAGGGHGPGPAAGVVVRGQVVVWAGGRGTISTTNDDLADRSRPSAGPPSAGACTPTSRCPSGAPGRGAVHPRPGGARLARRGRRRQRGRGRRRRQRDVAGPGRRRSAVRLVAARRASSRPCAPTAAPTGRVDRPRRCGWVAGAASTSRARAGWPRPCPAPSSPCAPADARERPRCAVLGAVVDAIASEAAGRLELPAPPPVDPHRRRRSPRRSSTRLDGSPFDAPRPRAGAEVSKRARAVGRSRSPARPRPRSSCSSTRPTRGGAWLLSVLGPGADGRPAARSRRRSPTAGRRSHLADELVRLERMLPVLLRPGGLRRGQVVLSQDEAWELMTVTGPRSRPPASTCGCPALSRRKPTPGAAAVRRAVRRRRSVGANQLADVRWSAVFDDVELTAADIARLAAEARPLVRSRRPVGRARPGRPQGGRRRARRAGRHDPAHRRRDAAPRARPRGHRRSPAASRVEGGGWAADLLAAGRRRLSADAGHARPRASSASCAATRPRRWRGSASSTPPGSAAASPSTWASARRRRCSPTSLARAGDGPALVIAPPAVVGNWAAEAARFTPGAAGRRAPRRDPRVGRRDRGRGRPTPTSSSPPTAPRCATSTRSPSVAWAPVVLDEAQAIKNPANDTAQQLRRIPARTRVALTGTPIENGLGDLWAILDFTNPGLVGTRPQFIAQLSSDGDAARGRGRAARPQRHPRVPPHQGRARDRRRAARPDRRARPLRDDPRADRPLPGRARQARRRRRPARGRGAAQGRRSSPPSPRSSRSATTPPRTRTTTGRSPAARASWPGSRRSSTRCSRPASASWSSPTSPSGA